MKKENQERRFLRGRDNSRCPRFRMRNLAAEKFAIGSHQISAANIVATRGLVDTFLSGDLRGFAHTFFRTDKVCPGFGQYVRVPGRFVRQFATKQLNRFAGGLSSDAITDLLGEFAPDMKRLFRKHAPKEIRKIEEKLPIPPEDKP